MKIEIVYWRDIPSLVIAGGRRGARRELPARFQEAIDAAAMRAKAHGTDAYLAAWRRHPQEVAGDDADAVAGSVAEHLQADYPPSRLASLVAAKGLDS